MPFQKGNQLAARDPAKKANSFLHLRCTRAEKADWVRAAQPGKLTAWVIDVLNDAAKKEKPEKS